MWVWSSFNLDENKNKRLIEAMDSVHISLCLAAW